MQLPWFVNVNFCRLFSLFLSLHLSLFLTLDVHSIWPSGAIDSLSILNPCVKWHHIQVFMEWKQELRWQFYITYSFCAIRYYINVSRYLNPTPTPHTLTPHCNPYILYTKLESVRGKLYLRYMLQNLLDYIERWIDNLKVSKRLPSVRIIEHNKSIYSKYTGVAGVRK